MDPASYTIRSARRLDARFVTALWLALHREHEALDGRYVLSDDADQRWHNDFKVWVEDDTHTILLGCFQDEVVGFIHAYRRLEPPIYKDAPEVYIDEVYVTPAHRARGLGTALLNAVRAWGAEGGAEWIRLRTLARNTEGIKFWEKHGGEALAVTYTLPLGSGIEER